MLFHILVPIFAIALAGCSGLNTLTEDTLRDAEERWQHDAPVFYGLVIEMNGERVPSGLFEVLVSDGTVVSLKRNGRIVLPGRGQDYSMNGLFDILWQELALSENPALLGAPPGFSAHLLVRFNKENGRLEQYRRTVGGGDNNINIRVVGYTPQ